MTCYVDRLIDYTGRVPYRHKVWCHLVADTDEELLACAAELGVSDAWLQGTRRWDHHFDLPAPLRPGALALGATEVDFRFMARRTRARRAALSLDADVTVGAPAGSIIEVPLPEGPWRVADAAGLTVTSIEGRAVLAGRPVVQVGAPGPRTAVAVVRRAGDDLAVRIGVVLGGSLRPSGIDR